ncbi:MAG: phospholipase C, phosphocholine-specific, partial [Mucilaginibacter polytrichastri]|nr:phospholipase C, phosphocholine-specific [Mucilaginibacter polytrichastri]
AEHVVFLMQENRSFDHAFGTLQGVRGFNDPRAISLPNGRPVWLQSDKNGQTYSPFRLNLKDTKATWMSSLPHAWDNQVDARNYGKHDGWLDHKHSGNEEFAAMPLTLGYYNREDIPFYYALADAFTICDHNFCSSLTGTSPNRLFFWTGTLRPGLEETDMAHVWNEEIDQKELSWTTFPERLEDAGIDWKIYQNELSIPVGMDSDEEAWLANFTDNDMESFAQYHLRLHDKHLAYLERHQKELQQAVANAKGQAEKTKAKKALDDLIAYRKKWNPARYDKLSEREKNLHKKAYTTNSGDPDYHLLEEVEYDDNGTKRSMKVPKGDPLFQFRQDVTSGKLPMVSWIVPSATFSDHPSYPWYGAWYTAEVMDILTKNPEVFRKTIFIITYDENDGYFDHLPPFVPPDMNDPKTGKLSAGIDTKVEHVTMAQETARGKEEKYRRESPIGLGYRVPMLVISPWSRGGWVNSEVFDHTSSLQFLENFIRKKTGKQVKESNISDWRRTVCGDLTSVFRVAEKDAIKSIPFADKKTFLSSIHKAQFKSLPTGYKTLSEQEIGLASNNPKESPWIPKQERGVRKSCSIPYELYAEAQLSSDKKAVTTVFTSGNNVFGDNAAGAPFIVYSGFDGKGSEGQEIRNYTAKAGDTLSDNWATDENGKYRLRVYGPNGFYRQFYGGADDPGLLIECKYPPQIAGEQKLSGDVELQISNTSGNDYTVEIRDNAYKTGMRTKLITKQTSQKILMNLRKDFGWYDFSVRVNRHAGYEKRYAGRVETGLHSFSDPYMGGII